MQVRMQTQLLSPSMQNRYHSICISLALPKMFPMSLQKRIVNQFWLMYANELILSGKVKPRGSMALARVLFL
jgi:hypothetical protein